MECRQCFPSQSFVVLTVDQFVGRADGPLERQTGEPRLSKNWHIASEFSEKSESSLRKRRSLRNCEKGMEFLTSDGFEDEYNK